MLQGSLNFVGRIPYGVAQKPLGEATADPTNDCQKVLYQG